jgi:hypothetical protein
MPLIVDLNFEDVKSIKIIKRNISSEVFYISIDRENKLTIDFPDFPSALVAFDHIWALYQDSINNNNNLYLREGV